MTCDIRMLATIYLHFTHDFQVLGFFPKVLLSGGQALLLLGGDLKAFYRVQCRLVAKTFYSEMTRRQCFGMVCFLSALKSLSHIERKEATLSTKYVIVVIFSSKRQTRDTYSLLQYVTKKKRGQMSSFRSVPLKSIPIV